MEEKTIRLRDWDVHYRISGHGPKYIMCLSGGFRTGNVFKTVWEGFDCDKFTVIAWDSPGYAKSSPPERVFTDYEDEAVSVYEFMKALKIASYIVLGFCGGGRVAMVLAAEHPEEVETLILVNTSSYVLPQECEELKETLNIEKWPAKRIEYVHQAGIKDIKSVLASCLNAMFSLQDKKNGVLISNKTLQSIQCKTMIFVGAKDPISNLSHATHLSSHIKNSRVHVYPEGNHFMFIQESEDFNERVQLFLLESL